MERLAGTSQALNPSLQNKQLFTPRHFQNTKLKKKKEEKEKEKGGIRPFPTGGSPYLLSFVGKARQESFHT